MLARRDRGLLPGQIATDIVRYRFSEGTTTVWFGSFDGLATTRPFGSPLLRPDDQSAVSRSACPLRRRRAVRPGPVAPTAWDRNPPGRSATSRSTASRVCAANRACASSCSCFVCKEEQARRFRAPGRQMEELGVLGRRDQGARVLGPVYRGFHFRGSKRTSTSVLTLTGWPPLTGG